MKRKKSNATRGATNFAIFVDMETQQSPHAFPYRLCKLFDHGGDISKRWCIEYYMWNVKSKKLERQRYYRDINKIKNKRDRTRAAKQIMAEINAYLLDGHVLGLETPLKNSTSELASTPLPKVMEFVFETRKPDWKENTIADYRKHLNRFQAFLKFQGLESCVVGQFGKQEAFAFADYLNTQFTLRPNSFNGYVIAIGTLFEFLVGREVIGENPFVHVKRKKPDTKGHTPFSPSQRKEIKEFLLEKGDVQLWLFINFIYYTFARPYQELRLLKVGDIKNTSIFVEAKRSKTSKAKYLIIPPGLKALIQEHKLREYPQDYYVFGKKWEPGTEPIGKSALYERHKLVLQKLGLYGKGEYTLYSWKHTGVISLFDAGADIKVIQAQCGHSDISQTDQYMRNLGLFRNESVMDVFPEI